MPDRQTGTPFMQPQGPFDANLFPERRRGSFLCVTLVTTCDMAMRVFEISPHYGIPHRLGRRRKRPNTQAVLPTAHCLSGLFGKLVKVLRHLALDSCVLWLPQGEVPNGRGRRRADHTGSAGTAGCMFLLVSSLVCPTARRVQDPKVRDIAIHSWPGERMHVAWPSEWQRERSGSRRA